MQNLRSSTLSARVSSDMPEGSVGGGRPWLTLVAVRGELPALLVPAGLALPGSELVGVGCSSSADRLALLWLGGATLFESECALRGGDTECVRFGGVAATT